MIFIVDDDGAVRDSLRLLLECEGFEARTFATGREFLDGARPGPTDCLILDVQMPGINGLDLLEAMRRDGNLATVIVVTARIEVATQTRALAAGARAVIEKPCPIARIIELIRSPACEADGPAQDPPM